MLGVAVTGGDAPEALLSRAALESFVCAIIGNVNAMLAPQLVPSIDEPSLITLQVTLKGGRDVSCVGLCLLFIFI